jgi:prolyl-tRNA editing enzyme YbaK/EbsC (Cys-tRNA(Pro) deacylase)
MSKALSPSARRVQEALKRQGLTCEVVELPASARTAREAAQAIGCEVAQIVKSLIFQGARTQQPVLVVASGRNRVNEQTLSRLVGEPISMANAEFVRQKTGFAIGGVAPLGHTEALLTFLDADLLHYSEIWAAAGTPHAVFKLTPEELQRLTRGRVVSIQ